KFINSNPPVCGNNLHEDGEDCDCGFEESCILMGRRTCCNPSTCTFVNPTYQCDEGTCCDKCRFKRGNICKEPTDECDLPDFCGGDNSYCEDNYKMNGVRCASNSQIRLIRTTATRLLLVTPIELARGLLIKTY
ncbi:hypothetical protein MXB_578, partial [Myxobolus squamalis]